MSGKSPRDQFGNLDIVQVLIGAVSRLLPNSRVIAGLDPSISFEGVESNPLVVVDDALPAPCPRPAWGAVQAVSSRGFDVDVFSASRQAAEMFAQLLCSLPAVLLADPDSSVVDARVQGSAHARPWSRGGAGERMWRRVGFELFLTYR